MLRSEADYKAKYISLLQSPGDVNLTSELVREFHVKYAPQIKFPIRFIVCDDYAEFINRTNGNTDHSVNIANLISAIYPAYFSPPLNSMLSFIRSQTIVSCGAPWFPPQDQYKTLDIMLKFDEPNRLAWLIVGSDSKRAYTFDWLPGLTFSEMKADYFNLAPIEFHNSLCALVKNCFAFWQKGDDFIVCAKPTVNLDFRYRLHSDTMMAARFPSGEGIYALRGVKIDKKYINEPVSGKDLMKEHNAEVRMVLMEKYGAKLLDDVPHKIVSKKGDGRLFGFESSDTRLIEITWDGYDKIRMLHLKWKDKDGEQHETLIHVPATVREFQNLGHEPPKNIDDCEEMRRWVMRLEKGDNLIKET